MDKAGAQEAEKMSQEARVLNHLKRFGSITPMAALDHYGVFRLAARIERLRGQGYRISTEMVRGRGNRFARYRLEGE